MGGLVVRCLMQKIAPQGAAKQLIDKFVTYGTPHGGIHFDVAGAGVMEKLRDFIGFNDSDNFGPQRMHSFLTRNPGLSPPVDWEPRRLDPDSFEVDRVFCIVGTNAEDYLVAGGLSRGVVGPQSDGLVQIENAYVHGSHRAYIHRSHSGRYGMVNSEEGYQNLQRFLFGDFKITAYLVNFSLLFAPDEASGQSIDNDEYQAVTYFVESQIAVRGLPVLMHERTLRHYCAETVTRDIYETKYARAHRRLPLFTNFLFRGRRDDGTMRYMIRLALFKQVYKDGLLLFADHLECLPVWSDYLIIEVKAVDIPSVDKGRQLVGEPSQTHYTAKYSWASVSLNPITELGSTLQGDKVGSAPTSWRAPLAGPKSARVLGPEAAILFEAVTWT